MASSHASLGMPVILAFLYPPACVVTGEAKPLSHRVTRGPASMIPSRASASVMTEARGPSPIGLRETTSTPMLRAARIAGKGRARWTPSRVDHSAPVGMRSSLVRRSNRSISSDMTTTRPADTSAAVDSCGSPVLGPPTAARLEERDSEASKGEGSRRGTRGIASPSARRIQSMGAGGCSSRSWPATPSQST